MLCFWFKRVAPSFNYQIFPCIEHSSPPMILPPPGSASWGCVCDIQTVEHQAWPGGCGGGLQDQPGPPGSLLPGPVPHSLAHGLPVSRCTHFTASGSDWLSSCGSEWYDIFSLCGCFRRGKELMPQRDDGSICYSDTHYRDTWAAMESLVDKGLVKAIGLSNFNARQMDDIISTARHAPVVNQVPSGSYGPE